MVVELEARDQLERAWHPLGTAGNVINEEQIRAVLEPALQVALLELGEQHPQTELLQRAQDLNTKAGRIEAMDYFILEQLSIMDQVLGYKGLFGYRKRKWFDEQDRRLQACNEAVKFLSRGLPSKTEL